MVTEGAPDGGGVCADGVVEKFVFETVDHLGGVLLTESAEEVLFVVEITGADSLGHAEDGLTDGAGSAQTHGIEGGGESTDRMLTL